MDKDKNTKTKQKKDNLLWVIAYNLTLKLLFWIIVPIVLAIFAGKWFDNHYNAPKQVFFLCFIGIAFIISSVGIVRESRKSMDLLEKMEKKEKGKSINKIEKK